jgi:SHS2 domain-containing protein
VFGENEKDLFQNAALAMFDLIADYEKSDGLTKVRIQIAGDDWPDLMVNWLRELLYLFNGKEKLIQSVQIDSIVENKIVANVTCDAFASEYHSLKNEVKAVTYHQIQVGQKDHGWEAVIIFDV